LFKYLDSIGEYQEILEKILVALIFLVFTAIPLFEFSNANNLSQETFIISVAIGFIFAAFAANIFNNG
jgi:hypothetical protein